MPAPRDRAALIKAARMYFLDGRSQDDVARALGTSRSNVSRMLSAARAQGIVEIRVHDQITRAVELEQALRDRFALAHVQVAAFRPGADMATGAGELAARWLDETLRDGLVLGLSWGTSCRPWSTLRRRPAAQRGGRAAGRRSVHRRVARSRAGAGARARGAPRGHLPVPARPRAAALGGRAGCPARRAGDRKVLQRRAPPTSPWSGSARSASGPARR